MEPITVQELLTATGGTLVHSPGDLDLSVTSVETDSRSIHPGGLFIPLVGEHFDGHDFIPSALGNGAAGCLTAREEPEFLPDKFYVRVENTQLALGELARYYRKKFPIPFIGITGSVGKTTTKDMVTAVLEEKYKVLKTEGNFNNEVGLPLTLFRLDHSYELCVLEMGMNHFGEIEYLSHLVEPAVAVITNIGDAHIENLGSRTNILKAKAEIFAHMDEQGVAILNGDDKLLRTLDGTLEQEIVYFGGNDTPAYKALDISHMGDKGIQFTVRTPKEEFAVEVPALGSHMIYPVLTAAAIGERFGMTGAEIAAGVRRFVPTKMRMNVIQQGSLTILDDAYNANPQSMRAALEVLAERNCGYKAAILGDMFELGALGPSLHQGIGEYAAKAGIDCLIAVGHLAKYIYDAANDSTIPTVFYCETKEEAKTLLPQVVKPDGAVLVKASRGMAFEELVRELKRICPEC